MKNRGQKHIILVIITILLLVLWKNNTIVFSNPIIQELLFIIGYTGIILIFINALYLKEIISKFISVVIFGPLLLIGFVVLFFVTIKIGSLIEWNGKNYFFENINEIEYERSKIKVYRTNGGATTDFGIIVRKEREIFPGVLYCEQLYDKYHMDTIGLELIDEKILIIKDKEEIIKTIKLE